jgi:acyl carrier protein
MDKPLDELGLDSMGAVNLLLDLEDSFEISFPGSLLTEETFRTAANLHTAVRSLV